MKSHRERARRAPHHLGGRLGFQPLPCDQVDHLTIALRERRERRGHDLCLTDSIEMIRRSFRQRLGDSPRRPTMTPRATKLIREDTPRDAVQPPQHLGRNYIKTTPSHEKRLGSCVTSRILIHPPARVLEDIAVRGPIQLDEPLLVATAPTRIAHHHSYMSRQRQLLQPPDHTATPLEVLSVGWSPARSSSCVNCARHRRALCPWPGSTLAPSVSETDGPADAVKVRWARPIPARGPSQRGALSE